MSEEVKNTEVQEETTGPKVFPMGTFVSCLKGAEPDQNVIDMLAFITQQDLNADNAPIAQALSKAWIYEQEPELAKYAEGDISKLGSKVQIAPLSEANLAQAQKVLDLVEELKKANAELKAENAKLAAEKAEVEAKVSGLEAKVKVAADASKAGEQKLEIAGTKIDAHIKKLEELMAEVEKVKSQGVVVAGAAGGGAAAPAADGGSSDAPATGGEPEGDFGFGSNPFADSEW